MHIPDGFLSTPVWAMMDAIALPSVVLLSRRAQRSLKLSSPDANLPLMGVMGAFIFAVQMINFPVGYGTSSHLVGGALLSFTIGPAAASVVLTAILVIQAVVFQDGGLLALGANVFNMAIAGVFAGYLPYVLLRGRKSGIFLGGTFSLMVSAILALAELAQSGVRMPSTMLLVSLAVFAVSAVAEGAITVAVVGALRRIEPDILRRPDSPRFTAAITGAAAALAAAAVFIASRRPDGIEQITRRYPSVPHTFFSSPLADYRLGFPGTSAWWTDGLVGLVGIGVVYFVCSILSRLIRASRPGLGPEGG